MRAPLWKSHCFEATNVRYTIEKIQYKWRSNSSINGVPIQTSASWVPLFCAHTTTRTDIKLRCLCVHVCSGGRVSATPVPNQVHANARSHETTPGSRQPRRKFHNHTGNNDLVPDQHGGKIWPNFSSVLIVNKWSVLLSRCTTTFHSDGLVNWLCECDLWIFF